MEGRSLHCRHRLSSSAVSEKHNLEWQRDAGSRPVTRANGEIFNADPKASRLSGGERLNALLVAQ